MHKQHKTDIHSQSEVYKLTCPDYGKAYVAQTGRNFATHFKEHKNTFRTASRSSNFAKYLINTNTPSALSTALHKYYNCKTKEHI
jgi:hypothetical protein